MPLSYWKDHGRCGPFTIEENSITGFFRAVVGDASGLCKKFDGELYVGHRDTCFHTSEFRQLKKELDSYFRTEVSPSSSSPLSGGQVKQFDHVPGHRYWGKWYVCFGELFYLMTDGTVETACVTDRKCGYFDTQAAAKQALFDYYYAHASTDGS